MAKPTIRFRGLDDEWEQRKLGDVAQEFKSGNSLKADEIDITGDYPVYGGNGLRGYTSTYNHDGEYALIGRQGALCGNMNYSVGKAYFTEHAIVVKADENNDTRFLYYMLDTMNLGQYSDQSAQPGLAVNKLVKLENQFPTKEEQQRMGWYFSNIDHLITLHQRKCDETKKLKKYMLQKMFPQNGSKVPEIRFKGFTDEWEQRKLIDVVDSVDTGKSRFDKEGSSGEYPILGSTSVIGYDVEYDYEGDFILTARVGANAGSLYRHAGKVKISDNTVFIQASQNIEFLYQLLIQFDIKKLSFGTGQPLVKASELKSLELMMPSDMKEQMRIGEYLKNLDHLITLHQHKCEELKKLKKFMLQNMFTQKNK